MNRLEYEVIDSERKPEKTESTTFYKTNASELEKELILDPKENTTMLQKVSDFYFKPKSFEKSGKLYEAFGVKLFRKYCPNGGSKSPFTKSMVEGKTKEHLESFRNQTKRLEGIHAFFFLPMTYMTAELASQGNYGPATVVTGLNVLMNIYPIITSRYNRNKVEKLIYALEEREK